MTGKGILITALATFVVYIGLLLLSSHKANAQFKPCVMPNPCAVVPLEPCVWPNLCANV